MRVVYAAKNRKQNRMIAPDAKRHRAVIENGFQSRFNPAKGVFDRKRIDSQVTVVRNAEQVKGTDIQHRMIRSDDGGLLTHVAWTKSRSGAIACSSVKGNPDQCHIQALGVGNVRQAHKRRYARETRVFERVDGLGIRLMQPFPTNLPVALLSHMENSALQPAAGM